MCIVANLHLLWQDGGTFYDMFKMQLPWAEKMLRPILVYLFLVVALRIFGKRELAQLNPFDLVVLLTLSNVVQNAIIGNDNSLSGGLIGALTLLSCNYIVIRFIFRHRKLDQILEGSPTPLIRSGQLLRKNLARELLTETELIAVAHRQGYRGLEEIESCTIEPGGVFYVEGKKPNVDDRHHETLLQKLGDLSKQIDDLKSSLSGG